MPEPTERSAYHPLPLGEGTHPVNTQEVPLVSEKQESRLLTEEKSEHPQREYLRQWRWEIFTFVLGTGAFATIIALLVRFRNNPPPDIPFGSVNIQLTAIIAALAQVAQSALMVPVASCIGQSKWQAS